MLDFVLLLTITEKQHDRTHGVAWSIQKSCELMKGIFRAVEGVMGHILRMR
jgi:hypothetical protein